MYIDKKIIKYNKSKREGNIKYIVIHDTGNNNKGAGIENHFSYFNNQDRQSSASYFVENDRVAMFVPDDYRSWHCGDGKGKYGITNDNSIGIEMCVNVDSDFNKTYDKTIELCLYLMKKYDIKIENIFRHYDASRKVCPNSLINRLYGHSWDSFISRLKEDKKIYRVQVGAYSDYNNAKNMVEKLKGYGFDSYIK